MPSPVRRSSRAAPLSNSTTSTTSHASGRQDRSTHASLAHQESATPHSLSSEEMSEPPRRSRRAHPPLEAEVGKLAQEADEEAADEDEEVTRCICGQQEYPGPPLSEAFNAADAQSDDAGGLFIQCDGCSVWQHGGCVGIIDESQSPDKYYCEDCRPKQHELHTDIRGQRYSLYLPVTAKLPYRKPSVSKSSDDKGRRDRADTASRASADPATGKRRATMRSREHDEEAEQIQRAIEESTREAGKRGGKRSRDESSDEVKQEAKRQRRISDSIPPMARINSISMESDDENDPSGVLGRTKRAKADAVQLVRQAEQREKERERERARAEAAGRRQERAGRRRGDEADAGEESTKTNGNGNDSPPPSSQPNSPPSYNISDKLPQKRGASKRVKKLGNNQYTKNRGDAASSPNNHKRPTNSGGTSSGDEQTTSGDSHNRHAGTPPTNDGGPINSLPTGGTGKGRWGKGKKIAALNGSAHRNVTSEPLERTIPNMARNLDGMVAFIQRAQLDVAEDRVRVVGGSSAGSQKSSGSPPGVKSAMDLADQLTRDIRQWQERFGSVATA